MACTSPAARVNCAGTFHQTDPLRRLHAPGFADFDFRVARVLQERRQPPDLEFCATVDEHVGLAQLDDEAGPRIDEVRIFGRLREDRHVDVVTADLAGDRSQVGQSRNDIDFGLRAQRGGRQRQAAIAALVRFLFS